ncbi:helix-turn-helix domain-containing protein [Nonomuraea sp. NPDC005650]|uniref:helix-turn-helix domain-containing protein n=1 Tax=Nonomuraea sp. NPDC005650 TaxID=3157045 RepID=UPI0033B9965B
MSQNTTVDRKLSRGKVARMAGVDPLTVTRWANAGKLTAERTPGGHRRYRESEVRALMARRSR